MDRRSESRALHFGLFELDVRSRELRKGTARIRLQEQPFEILRLLLERPGDVVTRDELRERLWPNGTFVDFEHSLNAAIKRLRAALGDTADDPRFIETLPRRGYRFIADVSDSPAGASMNVSTQARDARCDGHLARIAVLPFTNLSEDIGQQYFSDGLTEEMISQLGRLCGGRLGVIARWSSMALRGTTCGAREIGETLRVDYVLEGSVRRDGDRARITARLVETAGETHLWADTYERHLTDCFFVQADVAARIARSLAMELLPDQRASAPPPNAAAYQSYLKGRFCWNKPGDEGLAEAISYFDQALKMDSRFAPAHASKARALIAQAEYYNDRPRSLLEAARASATRALELDATHWRAHVALADVHRLLEWNWREAEDAYNQAIELNPSSESAHRSYGMLLAALGRCPEALRQVDLAFELDPLCLSVGMSTAWVRYVAGDYEGVIERCLNAIDIDPTYPHASTHRLLGAAHLQAGRPLDAVATMERALQTTGPEPILLAWLVHAKSASGDTDGANDLLGQLLRNPRRKHLPAYHLALAYIGVGDREKAFTALDQACLDCDPVLASVAVEPRFEPLRTDIRYAQLLTRLGLETHLT